MLIDESLFLHSTSFSLLVSPSVSLLTLIATCHFQHFYLPSPWCIPFLPFSHSPPSLLQRSPVLSRVSLSVSSILMFRLRA